MTQSSALEQYMLELVNAERVKAGVQPLASDSTLNAAADSHSQWMIDADTFSHTGAAGSTATDRMSDAGFDFTGSWASAENIAWVSTRSPDGLQDEVELLHANLVNSPGHYANIINPDFQQIGIGVTTGLYQNWDGAFVTQDFAETSTGPFLTGVAFDDQDGDQFYDPGEGLGGISVTAVDASGTVSSTTTTDAGGYDLALSQGTYTVTFSGQGIAESTHQITIGGENLKLDLVDPTTGAAQLQAASQTDLNAAAAIEVAPADSTDTTPAVSAFEADEGIVTPAHPPAASSDPLSASGNVISAEANAIVPSTVVENVTATTATSVEIPAAEPQQPVDEAVTPTAADEVVTEVVTVTNPANPVSTGMFKGIDQASFEVDAPDLEHNAAAWWTNLGAFDLQLTGSGSHTQATSAASLTWDAQDLADSLDHQQEWSTASADSINPIIDGAASQVLADCRAEFARAYDLLI